MGGINTGVVLLAQYPVDDINVLRIPISMFGLGKCHAWRGHTLSVRLTMLSVLTSKRQRRMAKIHICLTSSTTAALPRCTPPGVIHAELKSKSGFAAPLQFSYLRPTAPTYF